MNAAQRRAIEQARRKNALQFHPQDVSTVFAALVLYDKFATEEVQWPEFTELERAFRPGQEGAKGFQFTRRHLHIVVNSTGLLYGFASTGKAQLGAEDGTLVTDDVCHRAADLLQRLHAHLGFEPDRLPERMKACQDLAEELYAQMVEDAGLVNPGEVTA